LINYLFFPLVFYARETCSIIVVEKCKLRIFEKRELTEKFVPKRVELNGKWMKLYKKNFHDLYF
jgi:hypothetical protein